MLIKYFNLLSLRRFTKTDCKKITNEYIMLIKKNKNTKQLTTVHPYIEKVENR